MRPKAGRGAAAVAPIPEEARAPAASEPERLGSSFVAAERLTHPPSVGSRDCLTIPAMGDAGVGVPAYGCESLRMAWEAAAHALGSRRRRIPQPPPSHFRRRLKTQGNHSPATAKSSLPSCLSGPTLPRYVAVWRVLPPHGLGPSARKRLLPRRHSGLDLASPSVVLTL